MSIDPTLQVAGLAALEAAINGALALDPDTCHKLNDLTQQVFLIECTSPEIKLYIELEDSGLGLRSFYDGDVNAGLQGPAAAFATLLAADDKASALVNSDLRLNGDSAAIIQLTEILANINLGWETELANVFGDIPAHLLGQTVHQLSAWRQEVHNVFFKQLEAYIHEEARLSPPQLEVEGFFDDIKVLEKDTQRLTSQVKKLQRQICAKQVSTK